MNVEVRPHITTAERHLPFECVDLVLRGGGALGADQAGVPMRATVDVIP